MRIGGPNYRDTVDGIACDNGSNVNFVATVHRLLGCRPDPRPVNRMARGA
jgi:hypothetical protein